MKEFFVRLWTDQSFFVRCLRVGLAGIGELVHNGVIPTGKSGFGYYAGMVIAASALFIPAGQQNSQGPDKQ